MFNFDGVYLPNGEQHLVDWMVKKGQRLPDGRPTYQRHKYLAALALVPEDRRGHALDIGAHAGLWSMQMANDFDHVSAVEPVIEHAACWCMNMLTDNTKSTEEKQAAAYVLAERPATLRGALFPFDGCALYRLAVGDQPRDAVDLVTAPSSSGDTFIGEADGRHRHAETVRMARIDDLVLDPKGVGLLKIDCEGYELHVLQGASGLISDDRPVIVVEQKPKKGAQFGLDDTAAVAYLEQQHRYRVAKEIGGDYLMVPA